MEHIVQGQDEILDALQKGDILTLWDKVKYIGYRQIPSPTERKLIFLAALDSFDIDKCDNFVYFYSQQIMYAALGKTRNNITQNRKAIERYAYRQAWADTSKPQTQAENMLETIRI